MFLGSFASPANYRLSTSWYRTKPSSWIKTDVAVASKSLHTSGPELAEFIPAWLTLYVFLGLGDLGFTLAAFQSGAIEANPVLYQAQQTGLFEFSKIALTLLVLCVGFMLRKRRITEVVMTGANAIMVCLNVYHVSLLYLHFTY